MDIAVKQRYEAQVKIIKALAHPSRLLIVEELQAKERSVGELTQMIGSDTSTVSKHLNILRNAGLVWDEKRGTSIFYHLRMPCITDFMGCIEKVLEANALGQIQTVIKCKQR